MRPPAHGSDRAAASGDLLAPLLDLPGVADAVSGSRDAVDRLLAHRVLRHHSAGVSAESGLRAAWASAVLEGAEVSLAELRAPETPTEPVVQAALRVNAGLGSLAPTWDRAPMQVLARLHLLAGLGQVPVDTLGRPAAAPDVAARLDALAHLIVAPSRVPAVLLAAVVHGELQALAPFGWGDGLVARAAARLTLIRRGTDPKGVSVPEVGHLERRTEYEEMLGRYAGAAPEGVAAWLRHCCMAVELGAREGLAICEAVLRG